MPPSAQRRFSTRERLPLADFPIPAYGLIDGRRYFIGSVQFSSGCPYRCEFCDIPALYGRQPRLKRPEQVIAALDARPSTHRDLLRCGCDLHRRKALARCGPVEFPPAADHIEALQGRAGREHPMRPAGDRLQPGTQAHRLESLQHLLLCGPRGLRHLRDRG